MHELSLCLSLIDLVAEQQATNDFDRVKRVVVEVGALGHVDCDALRFSFAAAARGSVAEGSELEIRKVPGEAFCTACDRSFEFNERAATCPTCGGDRLIFGHGEELRLKELEVV